MICPKNLCYRCYSSSK